MAVIHRTTLEPAKLELLARWLPRQPWYRDNGHEPELARAGGFRLDDPANEVGIEFMLVRDDCDGQDTTYLVPLTYRSEPRASDDGLIGTALHGVLGLRYVYDAVHDPVMVAQLAGLIQGTAQAQMQSVSHTPDPTVVGVALPSGGTREVLGSAVAADGPEGTELLVSAGPAASAPDGQLIVRINRVVVPLESAEPLEEGGTVAANWLLADDTAVRGVLVAAHWVQARERQS